MEDRICGFTHLEEKIHKYAKEIEEEMISIFKEFHRNPELSLQEFETTKRVKALLKSWDIEVIPISSETGVLGFVKGGFEGPCIALRGDMDALPIFERTQLSYSSEKDGIMHACGHDSHVTMLLYAARVLSHFREEIHGSVKFIFQPAEEDGDGAVRMMDCGVLENPKVDAIYGVHNYPQLNAGEIALIDGPIMAAVHWFTITVKGVGSHGGMPQNGKDPIVAAAAMVTSLQSIVSRNVKPLDSAVVTISSIQTGDGTKLTKNVIPQYVRMGGTCRCYSKEVEEKLQQRLEQIVKGVALAYDVEVEIDYDKAHPVTWNHHSLFESAKEASRKAGLRVVPTDPSTGGEDFSMYGLRVPAFFYWVGSGNPDTNYHEGWHSPKFIVDPRCLRYGALNFVFSVL